MKKELNNLTHEAFNHKYYLTYCYICFRVLLGLVDVPNTIPLFCGDCTIDNEIKTTLNPTLIKKV